MAIESHLLRVVEVIAETAEATSLVFEVPDELCDEFSYVPGQFLTLAVPSEQTGLVARSYSLSSAPHHGPHQVTVKRTVGGYASNWLCDNIKVGDQIRVLPPSGIFTPRDWSSDLLLFAGGSGITPVLSILSTALDVHSCDVVLFYANRDEDSVIFADQLRVLQQEHPDRLTVIHWLESLQGLPPQPVIERLIQAHRQHTAFVCGPGPFMAMVTQTLRDLGFPRSQRHQEKFVSLGGNPFGDAPQSSADAPQSSADAPQSLANAPQSSADAPQSLAKPPHSSVALEVHLDGADYAFDDWNGTDLLLDFLESKGVEAPYSCREGQCSACACVVLEGDLEMRHNEVLEAEDLAEGIRLACQATALTERIRISYNA